MAQTNVREVPFYAPCIIEYLDAGGTPVPAKNTIASRVRILSGGKEQIVTLNEDGKPLTASHITEA